MGDVAHILGIVGGSTDAAAPAAVDRGDRAAQLLQALPKPVLDLLGTSSSGLGNKTTKPGNNNNQPSSSGFDLPPLVPASAYSSSSRTHNKQEDESQPTESSHVVSGGDSKIPTETGEDSTVTNKKDIVVKVGNKWIASAKWARPWVWAPFASSSRTDGLLLHHWVRANVEYPDYPFSRFDIHMDPVTYEEANNSDSDFYQQHLQCPEWSRSETDLLLKMAQTYELRWPVIYDRWMEQFGYHYDASSTNKQDNGSIPLNRKLEDLQHRYYSVAATLLQLRISAEAASEAQQLASQTAAMSNSSNKPGENASTNESSDRQRAADALLIETAAARALATMAPAHQPVIHHHGSGTSNKLAFDLAYERERRAHMEALWRRTPAEEQEEMALRKELKQVEAQLRKLKKAGLHIVAAAASNSVTNNNKNTAINTNTLPSSRNPSRAATPVNGTTGGGLGGGSVVLDPTTLPFQVDRAMAGTAPVAVPGTPYLQSARLVGPTTGGPHGINPVVWQRLQDVLQELKVPVHPLATKRACDLYDAVRRDTLLLLLLQKTVLQEEGSIERKRLQLAQRSSKTNATTTSSSSTSGSPQKQPRAVVDEETLLGIAPPPVPSPAPPPSAATAAPGQAGGSSKRTSVTGVASSGGGGAASGASKAKNAAAASASAATKTKTSATAAGGKPAPAVAKQSSGNTKSTATGGKQTIKPAQARGKQTTTGDKQPRKASTKRKRKTEAPSAVASAAALQPAATTTTTTATTGVATAAAAVPPTVPSAIAATTSTVPAPSEKGAKRPKKTG